MASNKRIQDDKSEQIDEERMRISSRSAMHFVIMLFINARTKVFKTCSGIETEITEKHFTGKSSPRSVYELYRRYGLYSGFPFLIA